MTKKCLTTLLLILQTALVAFAQADKAPEKTGETAKPAEAIAKAATTKSVAPKLAHPFPFKAGENLLFDISFDKFIFSGKVGEMKLSVEKATNKANLLALKGEIATKGFLPTLFRINLSQQLSALVSSEDLGVSESSKIIEDNKSRKEHALQINHEKGVMIYTFRNAKDKAAQPTITESPSPGWAQDILSIFYFARTQDLKDGAVIPLPILDEGKVHHTEIIVESREEVKVDAGKFKAIKVNAKVFSGRFIKRDGEMFIWFSDDARRLPVKAKIKLPNATVNIELKKVPA